MATFNFILNNLDEIERLKNAGKSCSNLSDEIKSTLLNSLNEKFSIKTTSKDALNIYHEDTREEISTSNLNDGVDKFSLCANIEFDGIGNTLVEKAYNNNIPQMVKSLLEKGYFDDKCYFRYNNPNELRNKFSFKYLDFSGKENINDFETVFYEAECKVNIYLTAVFDRLDDEMCKIISNLESKADKI